jgi:hypothetical protein
VSKSPCVVVPEPSIPSRTTNNPLRFDLLVIDAGCCRPQVH